MKIFNGTTHIGLVIDRSGSMATLQDDMIGGMNSFIQEQHKLPGEIRVHIVQFDTEIETILENGKLSEVPVFDKTNYVPRGSTALLDGMAQAIALISKHLKPEDRALVLVITDGQENASREYSRTSLNMLVRNKEEEKNWTFTYLSSDLNVFRDAASTGVVRGNTANFAKGSAGIRNAFADMGAATMDYLSSTETTSENFYKDQTSTFEKVEVDTPDDINSQD